MPAEFVTCSIIIASYEKPRDVLGLIGGLRQQIDPMNDEIIVIDDGSSKRNLDLLSECIQKLGLLNLVFIGNPHGGVSRARNTGIEVSNRELLIFVDQDAVAEASYLQRLRTTSQVAEAIQGNYWTQVVTSDLDIQHMTWRKIVSEARIRQNRRGFGVNTRNFAILRDVLIGTCGINPFDPEPSNKHGGEDILLGQKLIDKGVEVVMAPDAIVFHTGDPHSIKGLMRQKFGHGKADAITGVLPPDIFTYGNFVRAVLLPIQGGISPKLAMSLWASYTAGAALGKYIKNH